MKGRVEAAFSLSRRRIQTRREGDFGNKRVKVARMSTAKPGITRIGAPGFAALSPAYILFLPPSRSGRRDSRRLLCAFPSLASGGALFLPLRAAEGFLPAALRFSFPCEAGGGFLPAALRFSFPCERRKDSCPLLCAFPSPAKREEDSCRLLCAFPSLASGGRIPARCSALFLPLRSGGRCRRRMGALGAEPCQFAANSIARVN